MRIGSTLSALLFALVASASPVFAGDIPDDVRADIELVFGFGEDLAKIASAYKGDCAAMGKALAAWLEDNKDKIEDVQAAMKRVESIPKDKQDLLEKEYKVRAEEFVESIMTLSECADDPNVMAALAVFSGGGSSDAKIEEKSAATSASAGVGWGPQCKAYFAEIDSMCKNPADETMKTVCESLVQSLDAMKSYPPPDEVTMKAYEEGCGAGLEGLKALKDYK